MAEGEQLRGRLMGAGLVRALVGLLRRAGGRADGVIPPMVRSPGDREGGRQSLVLSLTWCSSGCGGSVSRQMCCGRGRRPMPSVRSATSATGEGGGQRMRTEKCVAITTRVTDTCVCTYVPAGREQMSQCAGCRA